MNQEAQTTPANVSVDMIPQNVIYWPQNNTFRFVKVGRTGFDNFDVICGISLIPANFDQGLVQIDPDNFVEAKRRFSLSKVKADEVVNNWLGSKGC